MLVCKSYSNLTRTLTLTLIADVGVQVLIQLGLRLGIGLRLGLGLWESADACVHVQCKGCMTVRPISHSASSM